MRFNDFKKTLRESGEVYVIGDSHAKAMGGSNNLAANGARLPAISRQSQQVPNGSTVYMTGGHNDVAAGTSASVIAASVMAIIQRLEAKNCTVNYILFPEGTDNPNQENMAPTREAIANAVDVSRDLEGCSLQSDGIHCSLGSYRGIVSASTQRQTPAPTASTRSPSQEPDQSDEFITAGPPYPREQQGIVQAMQYALYTLGYSVGETGFDGKYGPRTTRAVRAFKRDYNVPGPANQFGLRSLETIEAIAAGTIPRVETPSSTGNQPTQRSGSGSGRRADGDPNFQAPGYPSDMTRGAIENIIREEAELRGIDPDVAVAIFRHEGAGAYQSTVPRTGRGSLGGREASFGPYQLYIGGGLGNVYQDRTGRDLTTDNTREGIINQIRFALDMAIRDSWQPWYGRGPAGVGRYEGLGGARPAGNWS
jgi:peptidoglycan hydrolase-like protein with peptidoglycan-binding domain